MLDADRPLPLAGELAELAGRMSPMLLADDAVERAVLALAVLAAETIDGAAGAAVTLVEPSGQHRSTATTAPDVLAADELQYELGEGPCLTAVASGVIVDVPDLATDPRWPRWGAAVFPLGLRSAISVPLVGGEEVLGAVKVYGRETSAFDQRSTELLLGFAEPVALLLANVASTDNSCRLSNGLRQALHARDAVQQATGILMQRHGLTQDEALQLMVGQAKAGNRVLADAAALIVERAVPQESGTLDS